MRKIIVFIALIGALLSSSANASTTEIAKNKNIQNQNRKDEIVLSTENCTQTANPDYIENIAMDETANENELPPINKEKTAAITSSSATTLAPVSVSEEEVKKPKRFFKNPFKLEGGVAQSNVQEKINAEEPMLEHWINGKYATGEWFGLRPYLESKGITIESDLMYAPAMKTRGGMDDKRTFKDYTFYDLGVTIDTEKAHLWKGGTFYGLYRNKSGFGLSKDAMGDKMNIDGWDWHQMNQISEYWYQQKLFNDKFRIKFGRQNGNVDFASLKSGGDFFNTSHSINPTIPLPCFPTTALGVMAEVSPTKWLSLRDGLYRENGGNFNITELEVKTNIKEHAGRYLVGAWELSNSSGMSAAEGIDAYGQTLYRNFNRNYGMYAAFEQMIFKENKKDVQDTQGLTLFAQFGICPSGKNDFSKFVSGGLQYKGAIPKRDDDIIGVAVANGFLARRLADISGQVGSETSIEIFYKANVTPWFVLSPCVQLVMNPNGNYPNSVAFMLKSKITF
jgi:porin